MGIKLDSTEVEAVFRGLYKKPGDKTLMNRLVILMRPVCHMTLERFPQYLGEDIEQELLMAVMKKADYLAKAYCEGKIKSVLHYMFTFCRNNATVTLNKDLKHANHLVALEDAKIDDVIEFSTPKRKEIFEQVRADVLAFVRVRFPVKKDAARAEKFVMAILSGQRPNFMSQNIHKWYGGRQTHAKDAYSVVLQKIRERLEFYWEELFDDSK